MFSTPYNQRIAHEVLAINSRYAGKQNDIESGDAYDTEGLLRTGGAYSAGAMSAGRRNRTTRNTEMMTSSAMPLPTNEYIPHKRSGAYQTPAQVAQFYHTGGIQGGAMSAGAMTGAGAFSGMFKNMKAATKYANSGGAMTGARKYKKKGGVMSGGMMSDDEEEMYGSGQHEEVSEKEAKKLLKKHLEVHTGHKGAFATKFWSAFGKHYKKEAKRRNIMVGGAMTGAGFFSSIWKGVKKAGSTVYSGVSKAAKTGINAAKTVVGDAYSGVKTLAGDAQQLGMKGANNLLDQQNKMVNTAIDTAAQVAPQVVQLVAENPELLMAAGKHKKGAGGFNMFKNVGKAAAKYAKSGGAMTGGNWLTHNPLSGLGGGAMTGGNWLTHNPLSGLGRRKRGGANPNTEGVYEDMSDAIPVAQVIYDTPQQSPDVFRELKPKKRSPPPPPADRTTKPKKRSPPPPPPDRTKKTGAGMSKAKIRGMKIKDIMAKHGVSLGEASKMLSKGMA